MTARRGRTARILAWEYRDGEARRRPDEVIVEEPLTIHLDETLVATTMRTPGHDFELAVGFCHAEGILAGMPVTGMRYCGTGAPVDTDFNVVTVETGGRAPVPTPRLGATSSACGVCGSEAIGELAARLSPLARDVSFPLDVLASAPELVAPDQRLFAATGGVHAAAAIDDQARLLLVREDIGRHNAVDKVVGRLLLDGALPASTLALFVSGRASFEMVQKAWAAGFAAVVSVSAPSSLAIEVAAAARLTLAGFARDGAMNIYVE